MCFSKMADFALLESPILISRKIWVTENSVISTLWSKWVQMNTSKFPRRERVQILVKWGTVWKFHDFSIIQILCEFNFKDSWSEKSVSEKIAEFFSKSMNIQAILGTVWKFHDFSIAHILREIKFGDFKSAKSAILTYL